MFLAKGIEGINKFVEIDILKTVFKYVYNTMPELEHILFHFRKEVHRNSDAKEYI